MEKQALEYLANGIIFSGLVLGLFLKPMINSTVNYFSRSDRKKLTSENHTHNKFHEYILNYIINYN